MHKDSTDWEAVAGGGIVLVLTASIALVAAGGWPWFARFIESSAAGWLQAVGALVAIWFANRMGRAQMLAARALEEERRRESDRRALQALMLMSSGAIGTLSLFMARWRDEPIYPPVSMLHSVAGFRAFIARIDPLTLSNATIGVEVTQLPLKLDLLDAAIREEADFVNPAHFVRNQENLERAVQTLLDAVQFLFDECQRTLREQ